MYYQDYTGTSRDPYIMWVSVAEDYGNDVMGVGDKEKIMGVANASIAKVMGVDD